MDIRPASNLSSFSQSTFTSWIRDSEDDDPVVVDLTNARFIDPMGLALIAAAVDRASMDERPVEFRAPTSPDVLNYISRMHLGDCLDEMGVESGLPLVPERASAERLLELQKFDPTATDALAERVHGAVAKNGGGPVAAYQFYKAIAEVMFNSVEHSGIGGGWAVMQVMPQREGEITFAVADLGVGFETTLERFNDVDGPRDAIEKAFTKNISGTGEEGRGTGLDDLRERVKRHQGILRVWSGGATGRSGTGALTTRDANVSFPGTVIYAGFKPQKEG